MSLINEALKRAKAAQRRVPEAAATGPPLHPVEAVVPARPGLGLALPGLLALLSLLVLLCVWELAQRSARARAPESQAQIADADGPHRSAVSSLAAPRNEPAVPPAIAPAPTIPPPSPGGVKPVAEPTPADPPSAPNVASAVVQAPPPVPPPSTGPASESSAPKTEPLRLQGVVFNPRKPSAVINGHTLFLGDRIANFRVVAIRPTTAILVGAGQTNVLSLEP